MLIDPFYNPKPAYSDFATGVLPLKGEELPGFTTAVALCQDIRGLLERAGWTTVDAKKSEVSQSRPGMALPTTTLPTGPVEFFEMPLEYCNTGRLTPVQYTAGIGPFVFLPYDPFREIAPACSACSSKYIFYPMGITREETAMALAGAIDATCKFQGAYMGMTVDPSIPVGGDSYKIKITALEADAYELDSPTAWPVGIGGGILTTHSGYYVMRSKPYNVTGDCLECKIQTRIVGHLGGFVILDGLGQLECWLTISAANAGSYSQAMYHGPEYAGQAGEFQFVVWRTGPGMSGREGRAPSLILASMPKMDVGHHETGANAVVVIGSEGPDLNQNMLQLITQLNWPQSVASGFDSTMDALGYQTQSAANVLRTPAMMFRGLRGVRMTTREDQPLAQAPYILMSYSPNGVEPDLIGGKLWDMVVMSDAYTGPEAASNETAIQHDGQAWTRVSNETNTSSLFGSMWVLSGKAQLDDEGE
jgi:hypothetical protein